MSEETKLTGADVSAIEAEVNRKLAEEAKKSNEKVAAEVKAQVEAEYRQKELERRIAEQDAALKAQAESFKKAQEEAEAKLVAEREAVNKRFEELLSQRKAKADVHSPFDKEVKDPLAELDMKQVEQASAEKFKEMFGIRDPKWGIEPERYK